MKFYQLWASGSDFLDSGKRQIMSKKIFVNEHEARLYIPDFIKACETPTNDYDLRYILKVTDYRVLELECDEI